MARRENILLIDKIETGYIYIYVYTYTAFLNGRFTKIKSIRVMFVLDATYHIFEPFCTLLMGDWKSVTIIGILKTLCCPWNCAAIAPCLFTIKCLISYLWLLSVILCWLMMWVNFWSTICVSKMNPYCLHSKLAGSVVALACDADEAIRQPLILPALGKILKTFEKLKKHACVCKTLNAIHFLWRAKIPSSDSGALNY